MTKYLMIHKFQLFRLVPDDTLSAIAFNAQHIAEVAALTHFPTKQPACKNSKNCPTKVMPQFWQYAR